MKRRTALLGMVLICFISCNPQKKPLPAIQDPHTNKLLLTQPDQQWSLVFNDPILDQLVETGLEANLDISQAQARLKQLHFQKKQSRVGRLPEIRAEESAQKMFDSDADVSLSMGANLSWEIDLGDLLLRPDIRSAFVSLYQQHRLALVKEAKRYPSVSINLGFNRSQDGPSKNPIRWVVSQLIQWDFPHFDGGRRKAAAKQQHAAAKEQWLAVKQT